MILISLIIIIVFNEENGNKSMKYNNSLERQNAVHACCLTSRC